MRRFLRVRLVLVLCALVLAPAAVLPFAEPLRSEWTKFWEPKAEISDGGDVQVLDLPPGEWCWTGPASVEAEIVIVDETIVPDPSFDGLPVDAAASAVDLPPLVIDP